jgi:hypothetical protein
MTKRATIAAALALLALSGCERFGIGAGTGNDANASANASGGKDVNAPGNQLASNDAVPPGGKDPSGGAVQAVSNDGGVPALDRAFIVGRWSDRGDCTDWVEFANDGSFSSWDNVTGIWNLRDDRLTVTGARSISFRVTVVDQNTLSATNQNGETGRSTRC